MKLLHSAILLAAFLLLANSILPSDASSVSWFSFGDKTKDEKKSEPLTLQKDEENQNNQPERYDIDDDDLFDDDKQKMPVEDDIQTENVKTITSLSEQQPTGGQQQNRSAAGRYDEYDRRPAQSPFVDENASHPTVSQGPDPRFGTGPQRCQDGQFQCRKVTPNQPHLRCIPAEWRCNGVRDCEENDDEENCAVNANRPQQNQCHPQTQYTCYGTGVNGIPAQCVNKESVCNGVYDCQYGDDEDNDRCTQYGTRAQPTDSIPQPPQPEPQPEQRQIQQAPPSYPYPHNQPQPPQVQPAQSEQCPQTSGRSEEYVKKLEWIDRCMRSCWSNNRHR